MRDDRFLAWNIGDFKKHIAHIESQHKKDLDTLKKEITKLAKMNADLQSQLNENVLVPKDLIKELGL